MTIDQKKYQQAILYLCWKLDNKLKGKKKLAKLLYFVDFDFFEKTNKSITGDKYQAYPMGPLPMAMNDVVDLLVADHKLTKQLVQENEGYNPTEVYEALNEPDMTVFNKEEIAMLDRVILKYGHLNGKQLEDLTHAEAPYLGTESRQEIAYELAFYRGTDFSDNA